MKLFSNYSPSLCSEFIKLNQIPYSNMTLVEKLNYKTILYGFSECFAYDTSLIRTMRITQNVDWLDDIGNKVFSIIKSMIGLIKPYISKKQLYGPVIAVIMDSLFSNSPEKTYNELCEVLESEQFHRIHLKTMLIPVLENAWFSIQSEIDLYKEQS